MASADLQHILRDLPRHGKLVKDRGYRQIWRFSQAGRGYFLKFYPRTGLRDRWRRRLRGNPALREFGRLQWLQKANVRAPRAVAAMVGFLLEGRKGDAVILEAVEPGVQLDVYLNDLALRGEAVPDHLKLAEQVRSLVYELGKAGLGHDDLHLGNFLLHEGKVYLLDAHAVRRGGLRVDDVLRLGFSASRFATRTDLLRGWKQLAAGPLPPKSNPAAKRFWRTFMEKVSGPNRYFARLRDGDWAGHAFKQAKYPRRWSPASRLAFTDEQWRAAWRTLLGQIEADALEVLKRTRSGDVLAGDLVIGGRPLPVIVKRPRRKFWWRFVRDAFRGGRARRAWFTAWGLVVRNLPTAWPLLVMEKRRLGYVTDALIVFERVPGPNLFRADLDAIAPRERDMLFRRVGRTLREMERLGFWHYDAKSSNWIVREDDRLGPSPVMVDVDGVRTRPSPGAGIERLLRSMLKHPRYTPEDSLALCQGFAPYARHDREDGGVEPHDGDETPPEAGGAPHSPAGDSGGDEAAARTDSSGGTLAASRPLDDLRAARGGTGPADGKPQSQ